MAAAAAKSPAEQLKELGEKLEAAPPSPKDALVQLLEQAVECLPRIEQSPGSSAMETIQPFLKAVERDELLKHQDGDVRILLATCLCEITRITAPEAPYSDDVLRDIFHLIVDIFKGLGDVNNPSFGRRVAILETVARYRSCVVMLDLECDDLIAEMFLTFLKVISDSHEPRILKSMQTIMVHIIDESEVVHESLLIVLLSALGWKKTDFSMAARKLARDVIEHSAGKLEPYLKQFFVSSLAGDGSSLSNSIDHYQVIFDVYQCAPKVLKAVVPYITGELLADKVEIRSKAVELLGELFSLSGVPILESFKTLFSEFLKRLADRVVEIRVSVIEHLKKCLMSNHSRPEAPDIIKALCDRLLDYEENVRKRVVAAVCDVACHSLDAIPADAVRLVAERVRDKSLAVKSYTMERLADIYRLYCMSSDSSTNPDDFEWIPGKIIRCLYDKDFRPESIELVLCGSLFPLEFSMKCRVKHWVTAFTHFDKVEVKALEQILLQKQRLQQEMQKYISLRQTSQEDAPDLQKRILGCLRSMSRLFSDPTKTEENLNMLNHLKDVNIWKTLTSLLDSVSTFHEAWSLRADLVKIPGEKHPLHDFIGALSIRCSYLLVNKEYVKEILSEASQQKSAGNTKLISSCMNLLTVIASFYPLLLSGFEEDLVELLKEDNEMLKEGVAHVLSKAGGTIREQLATTPSSVDLLLERLCLEGTRKQAKYSVHALAAITKDDGLMSLSVLYKRLVDLLEEKKVHLPSILQSLGCIAQIAMPIFETREEEIINFINSKILECNNNSIEDSTSKSEWGDCTQSCLLKIYGIKTLAKSFLPSKDAQAHPGIEKLIEILKNVLSYGDISPNMISSAVDKAHMRLAAAKAVLRLSRQWDHKIPVDVFYSTMKISQDDFPQLKKSFLSKVHQYIKERILDAKYACAFLLGMNDYHTPEYEECKHSLLEVVQMCQQVKMRQLSVQTDLNLLVAYPEYIISYLVHALAHDSSCPNIEEYEDVKAFGPIYWRLHLLLSVLLGEGGLQHGVPDMRKESFTAIISIFSSIKCSQDLVDRNKTKILHAICDLGILITKRLAQDQISTSETQTVPLPTQLYIPLENNQNRDPVDNGEQVWLGCGNILAHFEAHMTENTDEVDSPEDKIIIDETDENGNEVPLVKIVKILKSQGAKNKRKRQNVPSSLVGTGNDDVLGLVREINLDSQGRLGGVEKSKPKKHVTDTKGSDGKPVGFLTPKRKRSVSKSRPHSAQLGKNSDGLLLHSVKMEEANKSLENKSTKEKKRRVESTDSDLLASPPNDRTTTSKGKKDTNKPHPEEASTNNSKKSANADSKKQAGESASLNGSLKKRKLKSISGLSKCSTDGSSNVNLVGCRIKVWWPLDKKFYEGVVQSYDSGKKKHVVLYDDGDVEILNLAKEKWELIDYNDLPVKRQKHDHPEKGKERPSPPKRKSKPKGHSDNTIRNTSGGKKSARVASTDSINDSDSSDADAHFNSDVDVKSDSHVEKEVAKKKSEKEMREDAEPIEENSDSHSLSSKEESDDETLSVWRQRAAKVT